MILQVTAYPIINVIATGFFFACGWWLWNAVVEVIKSFLQKGHA